MSFTSFVMPLIIQLYNSTKKGACLQAPDRKNKLKEDPQNAGS